MEHTNTTPPLDDSTAHYQHATREPQFGGHKPKGKKWLLWVGLAAVLVALGVGAYFLFGKADKADQTTAETKQPTTQQPTTELNEPQANATEQTFKSTTMNIEFAYRSDWKLKESSDKQQVTLTSPRVAYSSADGQATEGVFTVKLRHGVIPDAMQNTVQNSVAVKDSLVIAYAAPTDEQRKYTNLSYGGKDAKNFGYFIVTGSTEYKAGQPFGSQVNLLGNAYLFVGGYGTDAGDALAFDAVPATSFDTDAYKQAQKIIESLKIY